MKKETNAVDDFFRESLQDHKVEPSTAARSRFLDEALHAGGKNPYRYFRWYTIVAVAVVISASVFLYFVLPNHNAPAPESKEIKMSGGNPDKSLPEIRTALPEKKNSLANSNKSAPAQVIVLTTDVPIEYNSGSSSKVREFSEHINTKSEISITQAKETKTNEVVVSAPDATVNPVNPVSASPDNPPQPTLVEKANSINPIAIAEANDTLISGKDITSIPASALGSEPGPDPNPAAARPGFSPFLIYSLDWNSNNRSKLVHSLGVEGTLTYGKFSITSGASYATTTGYHDYEVEYNDFLGKYQKLDSITFKWDQKQYNLEPTYYMSETKVWDSAVKRDSYQEENRYSQLRVPVMLGYNVVNSGKFILGAKAGVEMLFYLKSRTITESQYSTGQNRLVNVNRLADENTRNNLWFMATLFADCNLSKRIIFEIEPRVQYLLNPDNSSASPSKQEVLPALRSSLKIKF